MSFIAFENGMRVEAADLTPDKDGVIRVPEAEIMLNGHVYRCTDLEITISSEEMTYKGPGEQKCTWSTRLTACSRSD